MPFDGQPPVNSDLVKIDKAITWLQDPNHWCKDYARDVNGATCLLGAIGQEYHVSVFNCTLPPPSVLNTMQQLARKRGFAQVWRFNDAPGTSHAQVMEFLHELRSVIAGRQS